MEVQGRRRSHYGERGVNGPIDDLWTDAPIAYRKQSGGDYDIPALTLKPGLGDARASGFRLHVRRHD
ncbi:hypothetical protein [Corallococcus sicarius]|uniref:Uncharacterized protein n=1 Tax=Corallococcus sicarius TaxID=2316726 RepID=A0A3A8P5Y9_9BACT|nr:hypothetical protein [Corallococcus sicarius]RKH47872.1 hypothetical protein D7X12_01310 [Corallococcus sicarius]